MTDSPVVINKINDSVWEVRMISKISTTESLVIVPTSNDTSSCTQGDPGSVEESYD